MGWFALDQIPKKLNHYPYSMVINLDYSNEPGSHWVGVFAFSKDLAYYFDSYGRGPSEDLQDYFSRFAIFRYNKKMYQSLLSEVCGYYVIFFIYLCSLGHTLNHITSLLQSHSDKDGFVMDFVNKNVIL